MKVLGTSFPQIRDRDEEVQNVREESKLDHSQFRTYFRRSFGQVRALAQTLASQRQIGNYLRVLSHWSASKVVSGLDGEPCPGTACLCSHSLNELDFGPRV